MITSPFGNLVKNIIAQLTTAAPNIKYVAIESGQLDNYEISPAVSWPCAIIDIDETAFSENGKYTQMGVGIVQVRIGLQFYTEANNLAAAWVIEQGLKFFEYEQQVHLALQGFWKDNVGSLVRVSAKTEKRADMRVREVKYKFPMKDTSTLPATQQVATPNPVIYPGSYGQL